MPSRTRTYAPRTPAARLVEDGPEAVVHVLDTLVGEVVAVHRVNQRIGDVPLEVSWMKLDGRVRHLGRAEDVVTAISRKLRRQKRPSGARSLRDRQPIARTLRTLPGSWAPGHRGSARGPGRIPHSPSGSTPPGLSGGPRNFAGRARDASLSGKRVVHIGRPEGDDYVLIKLVDGSTEHNHRLSLACERVDEAVRIRWSHGTRARRLPASCSALNGMRRNQRVERRCPCVGYATSRPCPRTALGFQRLYVWILLLLAAPPAYGATPVHAARGVPVGRAYLGNTTLQSANRLVATRFVLDKPTSIYRWWDNLALGGADPPEVAAGTGYAKGTGGLMRLRLTTVKRTALRTSTTC